MISLKQILIKGKRTFFILFVYPLQVLRSIVWLHMLHFIQGLPGVTQTMIHKDSQPLTSYVNIYPNITLIGKLSHREVVFGGKKKKPTKFRCIVFFLAHPLEKNATSIFFRCVEYVYGFREVNENWITRAASGVTWINGHVPRFQLKLLYA